MPRAELGLRRCAVAGKDGADVSLLLPPSLWRDATDTSVIDLFDACAIERRTGLAVVIDDDDEGTRADASAESFMRWARRSDSVAESRRCVEDAGPMG